MAWTRPCSSGPSPGPRCAHTTEWCCGRFYVFGGWSGQQMLNDVYTLQFSTMNWDKAVSLFLNSILFRLLLPPPFFLVGSSSCLLSLSVLTRISSRQQEENHLEYALVTL